MRVDKWLWTSRLFKTRQLAVKAIKNSNVSLNGQPTKPASTLKVGDEIRIRKGAYEWVLMVDDFSENRVSASIAKGLYHETEQSMQTREKLRTSLAAQPKLDMDRRKPDKRGVRRHRDFKRNQST